jgi:hypothetical protein
MHAPSSNCQTPPSNSGRGLQALPSALKPSSPLLAHPTLPKSHPGFFKPPPNLVVATRFFG